MFFFSKRKIEIIFYLKDGREISQSIPFKINRVNGSVEKVIIKHPKYQDIELRGPYYFTFNQRDINPKTNLLTTVVGVFNGTLARGIAITKNKIVYVTVDLSKFHKKTLNKMLRSG